MDETQQKGKILAILGPTAVGKSDVAVELAVGFNGEVVSADSRQVYRGLTIGTGKITQEEMKGVPHHLLDIADPHEQVTVVEWKKRAEEVIDDIISRGLLPIIAGGTGFYAQTVLDNVVHPHVLPNRKLRKELKGYTLEELRWRLKHIDPRRYSMIDRQNPRRLIRAIEIAEATGSVPEEIKEESPYRSLRIGLTVPDEELKQRIHDRLLKRIESGMVEEAHDLHAQGLSYKRMEELGLEYRYLARYLNGDISYEIMVEELENKIRQFAKRQMTWFKRDRQIQWFRPDEKEKIEKEVRDFLS